MACDIKPGESSENVKQLQRFLRVVKTYTGKIDGQYGKYTKKAVKTYQKRHKLYPDGYAGCKTTSTMKLECAVHNCKHQTPKNPAPSPTPPSKPAPETPTTPTTSLIVPNRILPNHTVSINNIGFYAESPELVEPFQRTNYDKIEIENGPPRYYPTNTHNREMNFKVTLIQELPATPYRYSDGRPNFEELLNSTKDCQGIKKFSSVYIGSFQALITIKLGDFKPGSAIASFNVQEIIE